MYCKKVIVENYLIFLIYLESILKELLYQHFIYFLIKRLFFTTNLFYLCSHFRVEQKLIKNKEQIKLYKINLQV